jgi:transketolase
MRGGHRALAGKLLEKLPHHVWVLCGDSEMAEGPLWEAPDKASYFGLADLTVIADVNRLGQRGPTELGWDLDAWYGRTLPTKLTEWATAPLGEVAPIAVTSPHPPFPPPPLASEAVRIGTTSLPRREPGALVATRRAFGDALKALAARPEVVGLDGEVAYSTYTAGFATACPERCFEMFISEQQLFAAAVGLAARGYRPFASTLAAFVSRAVDFIRGLLPVSWVMRPREAGSSR